MIIEPHLKQGVGARFHSPKLGRVVAGPQPETLLVVVVVLPLQKTEVVQADLQDNQDILFGHNQDIPQDVVVGVLQDVEVPFDRVEEVDTVHILLDWREDIPDNAEAAVEDNFLLVEAVHIDHAVEDTPDWEGDIRRLKGVAGTLVVGLVEGPEHLEAEGRNIQGIDYGDILLDTVDIPG